MALVVALDVKATFTGILGRRIEAYIPALGRGFAMQEFEPACQELLRLRDHLLQQP
jgi:hypothetical protein